MKIITPQDLRRMYGKEERSKNNSNFTSNHPIVSQFLSGQNIKSVPSEFAPKNRYIYYA